MLDLQRYAFYDAKRTMRLTLEPVSILEMLQDLPGELLFSAPLPAARLGVPCASPDVMHARAAEFAQFDEETGLSSVVQSRTVGRRQKRLRIRSRRTAGDERRAGLRHRQRGLSHRQYARNASMGSKPHRSGNP